VVLLDERGKEVSSEDVAQIIAAAGDDGTPLVFCIGGPFGHGAAVVERADASVRLSRCVRVRECARMHTFVCKRV
jgi:23S rRNA (pseudouridine1915-N3)-methyltransferase